MNGKSFSQAEINRRSNPKVDVLEYEYPKTQAAAVRIPCEERSVDQAPEEIGQELKSTSTRMQIERRQLEPKSLGLYHTHIQLFKSRPPKMKQRPR